MPSPCPAFVMYSLEESAVGSLTGRTVLTCPTELVATSWGKEQLCCALFSIQQAGAAKQTKEVKSYCMDDSLFQEPAWEPFQNFR